MKTKPFKHNFKTILGGIDVMGINGYQKALLEVYEHIKAATGSDPDKRFIDAVDLLERIQATTFELIKLEEEAKADLQNDIKNIFK